MQAVETHYLSQTNFRSSRIKAACDAGAVTLGWDHSLNTDDNHKRAASVLAAKLGWSSFYAYGSLKNGNGVHVPISYDRPCDVWKDGEKILRAGDETVYEVRE